MIGPGRSGAVPQGLFGGGWIRTLASSPMAGAVMPGSWTPAADTSALTNRRMSSGLVLCTKVVWKAYGKRQKFKWQNSGASEDTGHIHLVETC